MDWRDETKSETSKYPDSEEETNEVSRKEKLILSLSVYIIVKFSRLTMW